MLLRHDAIPEHGCPAVNEDPHFQNDFYPDDIVYTASSFHDELAGSESVYTLIDANGEVWNTWTSSSVITYNTSLWWWSWGLLIDGPFGEWTYQAEYNGEIIVHTFNYGVYAALNNPELAPIVLSPNPSNGRIYFNGIDYLLPLGVYNSLEDLVWQGKLASDGSLDLTTLSTRIYFLRALHEERFDPIKIIINQQ